MWDFSFQKESADNHDWTPGRLGAGYIHARTNTPDSFNLLDYSIRTWSVGPDYTDDIDREYQRTRPTDIIVFKFYITPTGGIHDRGEGFKNRTGKSDRAVIAFLHRKYNLLYDGRNDIKTSSANNNALHFNYFTGEPCYCGFGQQHGLEKEANLKYKDIKRGQLPEGLEGEDGKVFQDYIVALAEGGEVVSAGGNSETIAAIPGIKKVIPWIVNQMKKGSMDFQSGRRGSRPGFGVINPGGVITNWHPGIFEGIADLFNAEGSPYQNKLVECPNCEGQGETWNQEFGAHEMCSKCMATGTAPSNQKENLIELSPIEIKQRTGRHKEWVKEREAEAMRKADVANQERVYEFTDPEHEGWFVTRLNPDAGEAKRVGIEQGNCFQQPQQGYQSRVEQGDLTVYVLRDPKGLGHALWAYDRSGKIEVMEDSSKLYNKPRSGWEGYQVNNQWIRNMINETSDALGMQKRYHRDSSDVRLPDVATVNQFIIQFSDDDSDAFKKLVQKCADEQGIPADMITEVLKGRVDWGNIVGDLFNGPTTGNLSDKQISFDDFIKMMEQDNRLSYAIGQFVQEADHRLSDPEVEAKQRNQSQVNDYKEWKKIHSHPQTGKYIQPESWGDTAWHKKDYEEFRERYNNSAWVFSLPDWETFISEWGGKLPASLNPAYRQGEPVFENNRCKECNGAGRLITPTGYDTCKKCWGEGSNLESVVFPDPNSEMATCQSCEGSGVDQSKVEHLKQTIEQLKTNGDPDNFLPNFEKILNRKYLQNTHLRCDACDGSGTVKPAARLMEEGSGQFKFGKKKQGNYSIHFDSITGEPCSCGFGAYRNTDEDGERFFKEASGYKFKEIKNNPPSFLQNEEGQALIDYLTLLVKGIGENPQPGLEGTKTLVPWIVKQFKEGLLTYNPNEANPVYTGIERVYPTGNSPVEFYELKLMVNYVNANEGPFRQDVDWMSFDFIDLVRQAMRHKEWVEEKEENARFLENQDTVYRFDDSNPDWAGWTVVRLADENEVEQEGIRQGNCIKDEDSGYISAFVDGDLDLYVLRDPEGGSHAIWGYNTDDGSVAFMEDSSKRYADERRKTDFPYYKVNVPFIREMISTANHALELNDDYNDDSYHYDRNATGDDCYDRNREHWRPEREEEEEEEEVAFQIHLPDVTSFAEYEAQYGEDNNRWELAEREAQDEGLVMGDDTEVISGSIHWDEIAYEYFHPPRDFQTNLNLLNKWAAIFHNQFELKDFYEGCQRYLDTADLDEEDDAEVQAYREWVKLHINPLSGEFENPRQISPNNLDRLRRQEEENVWGFSVPSDEDLASFNGIFPAGLNPQTRRGEPLHTEIECLSCGGAGGFADTGRECQVCKGTGMMQAKATMPDWETRLENISESGGIPAPAAMIHEEPSGQLFMAKKKWDMTPLSFADQLKSHVASIEAKHSHNLTWVAGGRGRGLMLNDGTLVTWPVNRKGEPQHPDMYEYLTGTKLPGAFLPEHFTEGTPFDINEDGSINWFSMDISPDLISDISRIDYRLKTSAFNSQGLAQQLKQLETDDQNLRQQYKKLIEQMGGNWQAARDEWDKNHDPNDRFGDAITRTKAQPLIKNNIEAIQQDPNALHDAWLLVQHMDMDPEFQKWFINYLDPNQRSEKGESDYEYLHDRIQVGMGVPQTYGTQTGAPGVEGNEWNFMAPYYTSKTKQFTKEDAIELLEKNNWDFNADEFFMGMNNELEHVDVTHGDPEMTAKIVADHLREHPDYYTQLRTKISKTSANMFDFHFNCHTGEKCFCKYDGVSKRDQIMRRREASQTVRKVRNQKQKFLQNEEGEAIFDFLHRLISGHGINEQGKFGEGNVPGIEKMVPWIIKQIKTGFIRPIINKNNELGEPKVEEMRFFYGNVDGAKRDAGGRYQGGTTYVDLGKGNALAGVKSNIIQAINGWKDRGWNITTESSEGAQAAVLNCTSLSLSEVKELIESLPDSVKRTVVIPPLDLERSEDPLWNQLGEIYKDKRITLMSSTRSDYAHQALQSAVSATRNDDPDISKVPMSAVDDSNFTPVNWRYWSNWFNASNSPARRSRSVEEINGAINRGTKRAKHLNEFPNQDISLDLTFSNQQLLGLIAEQLGVDYATLHSYWREAERDENNKTINSIVDQLAKNFNRNIDQMDAQDVRRASLEHQQYLDDLEERKRLIALFAETKDEGVVYRITDPMHKGWTVHKIKNREEAELESRAMKHCIGSSDQKYAYNIDIGTIEAFSLRDEDGLPKLTWHYNPDGTLGAIQGKSNNAYPQFRHMLTEFNQATDRDDDDGGSGNEDGLEGEAEAYLSLPEVRTIEDYINQVNDPWKIAYHVAEDEGLTIDNETTELEYGDIDWGEIAEEFVELKSMDESRYTRNTVRDLFAALTEDNELSDFMSAVTENIEEYEYDIEDYPIINWVKLWSLMNRDPNSKRTEQPREFWSKQSYEDFVERMRGLHGDKFADNLPKWDDLADNTGLNPSNGQRRYLPANMYLTLNKEMPEDISKLHEEIQRYTCPTCNGKGYNYGVGQKVWEAKLCPTCNGEGVAEFTKEKMPQEYSQLSAPVNQTPIQDADWSMLNQVVCDNCNGQGQTLDPKPYRYSPDRYSPCYECMGKGHKTAKLSLKEKAAAWDKPLIKLTYAQAQYIDGNL